MSRRLHFIVAIRHPDQVRDLAQQQHGLKQLLASLLAQTDQRFTIRIGCNPGQVLPAEAEAARISHIDLPPNTGLETAADRTAAHDAVRRDKGARVAAALEDVDDDDFIMIVDDDDMVSNRLVAHALSEPDLVGHYVSSGYLWQDGVARVRLVKDFHHRCGTSIIAPAHYFRYFHTARDDAAISEFGSHRRVAPRPGGPEFRAVPFPGAIYRLGHVNASQIDVAAASGLRGSRLVTGIKRLRNNLSWISIAGGRPLTQELIDEFFAGKDPASQM